MSTALLKQTMLVTFKQTPVHTPNVLNEGQWCRKSETIRNFNLKNCHCTLTARSCLSAKKENTIFNSWTCYQPYNGDAWGLTHLYTSHFDVEGHGTHYSHNKFLEYKETRRAFNTPDRKEHAWLRQQGLTWYTDGSMRPSSFDTFFRLCWNTLLLFSVAKVLLLLSCRLLSFSYGMWDKHLTLLASLGPMH